MADFSDTHIFTTIHDFKNNISRYIRLLEQGRYKAVIIKRYKRRVGVFITNNYSAAPKNEKNVG